MKVLPDFGVEIPTVTKPCSSRNWARDLAPLAQRSITAVVDISNKCNIRCKMCHFAFDSVFSGWDQSRFTCTAIAEPKIPSTRRRGPDWF